MREVPQARTADDPSVVAAKTRAGGVRRSPDQLRSGVPALISTPSRAALAVHGARRVALITLRWVVVIAAVLVWLLVVPLATLVSELAQRLSRLVAAALRR